MIEAFGSALPIAVAVALSPLPIIAVVIVLLSDAGTPAGLAFLAGRAVGVAAVVVAFAVTSNLVEVSAEASPAGAMVRVLVGASLVVLAVRKWPRSPRDERETERPPGWMGAIEGSSPGRAARVAFLLSVANPKELLLGVGAGATIGSAALPVAPALAVAGAYTLIACVSVGVPVVASVVARDRVRERLERLRTILVRHNAAIMSVVLLVIGAALVGGGLSDL